MRMNAVVYRVAARLVNVSLTLTAHRGVLMTSLSSVQKQPVKAEYTVEVNRPSFSYQQSVFLIQYHLTSDFFF